MPSSPPGRRLPAWAPRALAIFAILWGVMLIAFGVQIRSLGRRAGKAATY